MHRAVKYTILFWSLLRVLYPKHVSQFQGLKNILIFSNCAVFDTLFNVRAYMDCWGKKEEKKNDPFYLFSCTSIISTFEYKWSPWGQILYMYNILFWVCTIKNLCHIWRFPPPLNAGHLLLTQNKNFTTKHFIYQVLTWKFSSRSIIKLYWDSQGEH